MVALQCELCGGKLIGKPGGVFECDSCGVEYSTEWCKAKVQEIKGTVKIEGPVEISGSVKVDGGITAESLLIRAQEFEKRDMGKAAEYYNRVLDIDPNNVQAKRGLERASVASKIKVGATYDGIVTKILQFGAFVELIPSKKEGMVHISKICDYKLEQIEDVIHVGMQIKVVVIDIDEKGRINLSMKAVQEQPEQIRCILQKEQEKYQLKVSTLEAERQSTQTELANLKGLFSGSKRRNLECRLAQIEKELTNL